MNGNIFLIGFMGAGKSTVARKLRDEYGKQLIEMDEKIEEQEGKKISEIFAENGEEYFRKLETDLLTSLENKTDVVVSCGGGAAMRQCNVDAMRRSGTIVYLSAQPETIYDRIKNTHTRPLLEGNMNVAYISQLIEKRLPAYLAAADVTIVCDEKSSAQVAEEIMGQC